MPPVHGRTAASPGRGAGPVAGGVGRTGMAGRVTGATSSDSVCAKGSSPCDTHAVHFTKLCGINQSGCYIRVQRAVGHTDRVSTSCWCKGRVGCMLLASYSFYKPIAKACVQAQHQSKLPCHAWCTWHVPHGHYIISTRKTSRAAKQTQPIS